MAQAYYQSGPPPTNGYPQYPQQTPQYPQQAYHNGGPPPPPQNGYYQPQGGPQMHAPAPYAQQTSAGWPQDKPGNGTYGNGSDDQQRFTAPSKMPRDPIFLILFLANTLGFAALSGIVINSYIKSGGNGGGLSGAAGALTLNRQTVYLLLVITGTAFVVASLYLMLVRAFTKIIMEVSEALRRLDALADASVGAYRLHSSYRSSSTSVFAYTILSKSTGPVRSSSLSSQSFPC